MLKLANYHKAGGTWLREGLHFGPIVVFGS